MDADSVRVVLDMDIHLGRRLAAAADLKGISVRRYCLTAIDRELSREEGGGSSDKPDHEMFAELRREMFKDGPLPGNSVDLLREAREIREEQMDGWV